MLAGVAASDAPTFAFFDADAVGLRPEHVKRMLALRPVPAHVALPQGTPPPRPVVEVRSASPVVEVDHPFLFFIRDAPTGAVLFAGRVADPSAH